MNISSSGIVSVNYTENFSGSRTVTATIVDSVLYDASDTGTISGSSAGGGGGGNLTLTSAKRNGNSSVSFTWTGGQGPFSVFLASGGSALCSAPTNNNACTFNGPLPVGTNVRVKDANNMDDTTQVTN